VASNFWRNTSSEVSAACARKRAASACIASLFPGTDSAMMAKREEPRRVPDDLCANAAIASVNITQLRTFTIDRFHGRAETERDTGLERGKA